MTLKDKVAIVTGGNSGIGKAIAVGLAKAGASIVIDYIADPEATNPATTAAGDEIVIDDRRLFGEHRVAEMLGCSLRTLQRWRKEGKGPPSTKIGRQVYYDLNDLQEWIDRGKNR